MMHRIKSSWLSWVQFWSQKEHGTALAIFRIAMGLTLIYTFNQPLQDGIYQIIWVDKTFGGLRDLNPAPWLIELLGGATPDAIWRFICLGFLCGVALLLGIFPRFFALLGMFLMNNISWHNAMATAGHDDLIANALWLLVFANSAQTLSVMCKIKTGLWQNNTPIFAFPRYLILLQLIWMYTSTGLQKLSVHWIPFGKLDALWYILLQPTWAKYDFREAYFFYPLTQVATFSVWCFEVFSPLLLIGLYLQNTSAQGGWLRKRLQSFPLRRCFMAIGIPMHIGIHLLMAVGPFSIASVAYYAALIKIPAQPEPVSKDHP